MKITENYREFNEHRYDGTAPYGPTVPVSGILHFDRRKRGAKREKQKRQKQDF
jgi:hypothetical protein